MSSLVVLCPTSPTLQDEKDCSTWRANDDVGLFGTGGSVGVSERKVETAGRSDVRVGSVIVGRSS